MPAERHQMPADGLDVKQAKEGNHSDGNALEREIKPFTGIDAARDYRAMYKAAFAYHERHSPPEVDLLYWQTHTPGTDETPQRELAYWEKAALDISETSSSFGNDRFMIDLLCAIYDELGREYAGARQRAANAGQQSGDQRGSVTTATKEGAA